MTFENFTSELQIAEYARHNSDMFSENESLSVSEIGDGNLNFVYRVSGESNSLIVKQALPYIRVIGEGWPLTQDRIRIEASALEYAAKHGSEFVPKVYDFSQKHCCILMEDIGEYQNLREALCEQKKLPTLANELATFLANCYFSSSLLAQSSTDYKKAVSKFSNPDLCAISEEVYFWDPFCDHERNQVNPGTEAIAAEIWQDDEIAFQVACLKNKFMAYPQALLHGDLHTGSVFVTESNCKLIDPEFAFYGPIGFDIGTLFANLILSYAAHSRAGGNTNSEAYRSWLLETIQSFWNTFVSRYLELMQQRTVDPSMQGEKFQQTYINDLLQDTFGFAAVEISRRTIGIAHVADLELIEQPDIKSNCEQYALRIASHLLKHRTSAHTVEEICNQITNINA